MYVCLGAGMQECVCMHLCSEMYSETWPPMLEGTAGLGVCVWMHVCTAVLVSFSPNSLEYLEAPGLTTLKSFSHLSSEDSHFSITPLFGSKTKFSSISRLVLMSTCLHTSRYILGT